jgi:hypothetical protein
MRVPGTRSPSSVGLCRKMGALVSGELVVDASELLRLAAVGADQLATIELVGGTVKLKYRAIGQVVADLREQYVTGTLAMRWINQ